MNKQNLVVAALVCAVIFVAVVTHAQEIDTRIGKIETINGFPTAAAAQKLFDENDFQRATQTYLWALPLINRMGMKGGSPCVAKEESNGICRPFIEN